MLKLIVIVSSTNVTNIKKNPSTIPDDNRETQLLFGETVFLKSFICKDYMEVIIPEQTIYNKNKWEPYSGIIHSSSVIPITTNYLPSHIVSVPLTKLKPQNIELFFGSCVMKNSKNEIILPNGEKSFCPSEALAPIPKKIKINKLIENTKIFIDIPYLWGGRTLGKKINYLGVDCSGLIHLLYKQQGVLIPRNSKDQYLFCSPVKNFLDLPIGGAIFLSNSNSSKEINHVILKINETTYIEASRTQKKVRLLTIGKELSVNKNKLTLNSTPDTTFKAFFGKFF